MASFILDDFSGAPQFTFVGDWSIVDLGGTHGKVMKSSVIPHGGVTELTLTVTLKGDGKVRFDAMASSENGFDYGRFYIDGVNKFSICGPSETWNTYEYPLTTGTHTLKWRYDKDGSAVAGQDAFFFDNLYIDGLENGVGVSGYINKVYASLNTKSKGTAIVSSSLNPIIAKIPLDVSYDADTTFKGLIPDEIILSRGLKFPTTREQLHKGVNGVITNGIIGPADPLPPAPPNLKPGMLISMSKDFGSGPFKPFGSDAFTGVAPGPTPQMACGLLTVVNIETTPLQLNGTTLPIPINKNLVVGAVLTMPQIVPQDFVYRILRVGEVLASTKLVTVTSQLEKINQRVLVNGKSTILVSSNVGNLNANVRRLGGVAKLVSSYINKLVAAIETEEVGHVRTIIVGSHVLNLFATTNQLRGSGRTVNTYIDQIKEQVVAYGRGQRFTESEINQVVTAVSRLGQAVRKSNTSTKSVNAQVTRVVASLKTLQTRITNVQTQLRTIGVGSRVSVSEVQQLEAEVKRIGYRLQRLTTTIARTNGVATRRGVGSRLTTGSTGPIVSNIRATLVATRSLLAHLDPIVANVVYKSNRRLNITVEIVDARITDVKTQPAGPVETIPNREPSVQLLYDRVGVIYDK